MTVTRFESSGMKKRLRIPEPLFLFQVEMFSAGGPTEQAQDEALLRAAQKTAQTIEMSLRSTLPGRPLRRKSAAVEAASCCAADAAELRRARKRLHRERG